MKETKNNQRLVGEYIELIVRAKYGDRVVIKFYEQMGKWTGERIFTTSFYDVDILDDRLQEAIDIVHPEIVKENDKFIPVHINMVRDENFFYGWNSNSKAWYRSNELPENLKRSLKNPLTKSNYK